MGLHMDRMVMDNRCGLLVVQEQLALSLTHQMEPIGLQALGRKPRCFHHMRPVLHMDKI